MRISDWSSDVCSSDLETARYQRPNRRDRSRRRADRAPARPCRCGDRQVADPGRKTVDHALLEVGREAGRHIEQVCAFYDPAGESPPKKGSRTWLCRELDPAASFLSALKRYSKAPYAINT